MIGNSQPKRSVNVVFTVALLSPVCFQTIGDQFILQCETIHLTDQLLEGACEIILHDPGVKTCAMQHPSLSLA
jgi:hypothetical protein